MAITKVPGIIKDDQPQLGEAFPNNQWSEGGQSIGVSHGLETEPQDDDIKPFSWDRFSL